MQVGFTFSDVYDEVVSRAGGEQSTAEDVIRVRRGLRLLLERWEAMNFNTWRIRSAMVPVLGLTPEVKLQRDVDDVLTVQCHRQGYGGGGVVSSSTLERINIDRYTQLTQKWMQGTPSQYLLDRTECPKLLIYPIGGTTERLALEVWYVQRPADFDPTKDGMGDVPGRWLEALIVGLAHDLARKRPGPNGAYSESLIQRLKAESSEAENLAWRADRQRVRYNYRIGGV